MGIVEVTLILTVAALYLAIVMGRIGTNQLVLNAQLCSGLLKERDQFTVGLSKAFTSNAMAYQLAKDARLAYRRKNYLKNFRLIRLVLQAKKLST